jgi:hypothetical protein
METNSFLEEEVLLLRMDYMELNHGRVNWSSFVVGYCDEIIFPYGINNYLVLKNALCHGGSSPYSSKYLNQVRD